MAHDKHLLALKPFVAMMDIEANEAVPKPLNAETAILPLIPTGEKRYADLWARFLAGDNTESNRSP